MSFFTNGQDSSVGLQSGTRRHQAADGCWSLVSFENDFTSYASASMSWSLMD